MVYSAGGAIEASDYNNLIAQINMIFGVGNGDSGYGGNSVSVSDIGNLDDILQGGEITNELWENLRNAFADCAEHQGSILTDGLPPLVDIENGDIASFFPLLNSSQNIFDLVSHRNQNNTASFTPIMTPNPNNINNARNTQWGSFVQHVFSIKFIDSDHARYFFNTGGSIHISASRTGGTASVQNQAWDSIINGNIFTFTGEHYYALTPTAENLRPQISPLGGAYAIGANSIGSIWSILGQTVGDLGINGANGSEIKIYSNFLDGGTNSPDLVNGTLTSIIEEIKYTDVFSIESPIYTTITDLSSGN